jgi:hypothetical protein
MTESDKSIDVFGTKPLAEATKTVVDTTVHGVAEFLGRICLPAAEEFGLLLRDKVGAWRARNALALTLKAKDMIETRGDEEGRHAHPRIVGGILEHGSWSDDDEVQGMWAGLLASACTKTGRAQENLIYMNYLAQITTSQAKTLTFACESARKYKSSSGLLLAQRFVCSVSEITMICGNEDLHSMDLELDHLRSLGLIDSYSGLNPNDAAEAYLTPSAIALQLYVRCQGYVGSPVDYFGL